MADKPESLFASIIEFQREREASAKKIVDSAKNAFNLSEELEPGASAAFAAQYGAWYDGIRRDVEAAGFRYLGEYQTAKSDKPEDQRSFYGFALSGDGASVASWFYFPAKEPKKVISVSSYAVDGRGFTAVQGVAPSIFGIRPGDYNRYVPADMSVGEIIRTQRSDIASSLDDLQRFTNFDEIRAARDKSMAETNAYRKRRGFLMFEPMLRNRFKDEFEEAAAPMLTAMYRHPEWMAAFGADGAVPPARLPLAVQMRFLMSRNDPSGERRDITSFGMAAFGMPELTVPGIAANHARAARFLIMTVGRRLFVDALDLADDARPLAEQLDGREIALRTSDAPSDEQSPVLGDIAAPDEMAMVMIRLERVAAAPPEKPKGLLGRFMNRQRESEALYIVPPRGATMSKDEWLPAACRQLGLDVPAAQSMSTFRDTMQGASRAAVETLFSVRERLDAGLPDGHTLVVKQGMTTSAGNREFLWIHVRAWPPGEFVGQLLSKPDNVPGIERGQTMRIPDGDVYDYAFYSTDGGLVTPSRTDVVAQDYGVDVS